MKRTTTMYAGLSLALAVLAGTAQAALAPPTAAAAEAAAVKKAAADAQAEKDKQNLLAKQDDLAKRWRANAAKKGWASHPATPVAAPKAAVSAPATQSGSSGQPGGAMGAAAKQAPITSEKSGTAPPNTDGKKAPADALKK